MLEASNFIIGIATLTVGALSEIAEGHARSLTCGGAGMAAWVTVAVLAGIVAPAVHVQTGSWPAAAAFVAFCLLAGHVTGDMLYTALRRRARHNGYRSASRE